MKLYATIDGERKDKITGKKISKGLGQNEYLNVNITGEDGEFLGSIRMKLSHDTVGPVWYATIDFAEYVYVNGHH